MNQSLRVSGIESGCQLSDDAQCRDGVHRSQSNHVFLKRATIDKLHHKKRNRAIRFDMMNGNDILMHHSRSGLTLARKPTPGRAIRRESWSQYLYRDNPIQLGINRLENDARAAGPDHTPHSVASNRTNHFRIGRETHQATFYKRVGRRRPGMIAEFLPDPCLVAIIVDSGIFKPLSCFPPPIGFGRKFREPSLAIVASIQVFCN